VFLYEQWTQSALACSDRRNGSSPDAQGRNGSPAEPFSNTRDAQHARYISVAVGHIHQFSADYTNQYVRIWFPPGTAYRHLIFRHAPRLGKLRSRYMTASFGNRRRFFAALCTANLAGLFSPSSWRSSIRGNPPPIRISSPSA
jgi:hypothetical protein